MRDNQKVTVVCADACRSSPSNNEHIPEEFEYLCLPVENVRLRNEIVKHTAYSATSVIPRPRVFELDISYHHSQTPFEQVARFWKVCRPGHK